MPRGTARLGWRAALRGRVRHDAADHRDEPGSGARRAALDGLAARRRRYRSVCDSASPTGMLAAIE